MQNISHSNVDVNLMLGYVTQDKNGAKISVTVSLKNQ